MKNPNEDMWSDHQILWSVTITRIWNLLPSSWTIFHPQTFHPSRFLTRRTAKHPRKKEEGKNGSVRLHVSGTIRAEMEEDSLTLESVLYLGPLIQIVEVIKSVRSIDEINLPSIHERILGQGTAHVENPWTIVRSCNSKAKRKRKKEGATFNSTIVEKRFEEKEGKGKSRNRESNIVVQLRARIPI